MKKKMTKAKAKMKKVMTEFKEHKLHSGSKKGPEVTNPKQAVAIAYSEAKKAKKDSKPKHKMMKPTLKKDGYEMHHGEEIKGMMKKHKAKSKASKKPSKSKDSAKSAKNEHSGNENKDEESKIKMGGYKVRPIEEVRDMMEENMHAAANIKRHSSKGLIPAEGLDESFTGSQRLTRKNKVTDLNHGKKKLVDDPYYEVAEEDSIASYKRAGLDKNSGADDEKEDLRYAKKMKVGVKTKSNSKTKKKK
jgi:hypothetical protein